jgi:hypothetical protein
MGPKLDVKVGDEVAVVSYRNATRLAKVTAIQARGRIEADGSLWRPDGTAFHPGFSAPRLEIVTNEHRAAVAEETERSRVRRAIDRFPELRNHLPTGRTELLREAAVHLEAALALLDGAK